MAVGVLVAFEAFEDIEATGVPGLGGEGCRTDGANAAATDEHDQRFRIDLALEFGQEMGVADAARILVPLDFDSAGNASDPVEFGARAHIDQTGTRCQVQQLAGFLRGQFTLVGALQCLSAGPGKGENFR